ncbi:MAG: hypothetical protein FWC73_07675 [Defluviitaleaceae bacterium]|nr:hypothetical protein [Defluviitaleaceae bacterium]
MSEKNIEATMNEALSGDNLKNALDFAKYLKAKGMDVNGAEVSYNGKTVCYMHMDGGNDYPSPWTIWSGECNYTRENENIPLDASMKEIAWANVNICGKCGGGCAPGTTKTIFGKEFENVCSSDMAFYQPNSETLEVVKKLLEMKMLE